MFIYNVKINGSKTFKYFFITVTLVIIIIVGIVSFKVFNGANNAPKNSSCLPQNKVTKLTTANYTTVLKTVHDNIDSYVGCHVNFTGYIYRVSDLKETEFILARNMIISSDFQAVVVGFLCDCDNAKDFKNDDWVEVTGKITKGNYHGDMPIVKITEIKKVEKPNDEFVYPPDESYIPTSGIL